MKRARRSTLSPPSVVRVGKAAKGRHLRSIEDSLRITELNDMAARALSKIQPDDNDDFVGAPIWASKQERQTSDIQAAPTQPVNPVKPVEPSIPAEVTVVTGRPLGATDFEQFDLGFGVILEVGLMDSGIYLTQATVNRSVTSNLNSTIARKLGTAMAHLAAKHETNVRLRDIGTRLAAEVGKTISTCFNSTPSRRAQFSGLSGIKGLR